MAGARACPPEDCGGTPGYSELVEILANLGRCDHDDMLRWLGIENGSGLASFPEIGKAPVEWHWRPRLRPVSNHVIRRPLRIWSAEGSDAAALEALGTGDAEVLRLPEPSDAAMREQDL